MNTGRLIKAFNDYNNKYRIESYLLEDNYSYVFLLTNGFELRITTNFRTYLFSKKLKTLKSPHIVFVYDYFIMTLSDNDKQEEKYYCIITEHINRDFLPKEIIQSAVTLFKDSVLNYCNIADGLSTTLNEAYAKCDEAKREKITKIIKDSKEQPKIKEIAISLNRAYKTLFAFDIHSLIFLYPDNIGISNSKKIKIGNISHDSIGIDANYDLCWTRNSVTVIYDPSIHEIDNRDMRLLIPVYYDYGNGYVVQEIAEIDTGAEVSGFTESFAKKANLSKLDRKKISGTTGSMTSFRTKCCVEFPNGHKEVLQGSIIKDSDVKILIGMDLLSKCKFIFEPYNYGFKYKLSF